MNEDYAQTPEGLRVLHAVRSLAAANVANVGDVGTIDVAVDTEEHGALVCALVRARGATYYGPPAGTLCAALAGLAAALRTDMLASPEPPNAYTQHALFAYELTHRARTAKPS